MSNCNVITLSSYSNSVKVMDIAWFFFASKDPSRVWSPYIFVYMVTANNRVKLNATDMLKSEASKKACAHKFGPRPSNFCFNHYYHCKITKFFPRKYLLEVNLRKFIPAKYTTYTVNQHLTMALYTSYVI